MTKRAKFFIFANIGAAAAVVYASQLPIQLVGTPRYQKPVVVPNPTEAPFLITKLQDGAPLSGETAVEVAVFSRYANVNEIYLLVDGKPHSQNTTYSNTPAPPLQIEPNIATLALQTREFNNGSHLLTVQDERGFKQQRRVVFKNDLIFLNAETVLVNDGMGPYPQRLQGRVADPQRHRRWIVVLRDIENNRVVKVFAGSRPRLDIAWHGRDRNGKPMGESVYLFDFYGAATIAEALKRADLPPDTKVARVP